MKKYLLIILLTLYTCSSAQELLLLNSAYIPHTDTSYVFIPKNAVSTDHFPTVIMMHGWAGSYKQWNEIIDLQNIADSLRFILICPDGFYDSYYINSPVREDSQFESFFWEVFIPAIFNKYPIDKKKSFYNRIKYGRSWGNILVFKKTRSI